MAVIHRAGDGGGRDALFRQWDPAPAGSHASQYARSCDYFGDQPAQAFCCQAIAAIAAAAAPATLAARSRDS